jgi:L-alanine-DL-glutamate epimerase-like enolase superfamily enzyme
VKVTHLDALRVRIPQIHPIAPYQNRYRPGTHKEALLVKLVTDTGHTGWGECPDDYLNRSYEGVPTDLLRKQVLGRDPHDLEAWAAENTVGTFLASAVEMAFWDVIGQSAGKPLHQLLGGLLRPRVELAACMGIRPYDEAKAIARHYLEQGFTTLKTKAGRRAEEDLDMVRGIRDGVGDRLKLRIDPNQGYDPPTALQLSRDLERYSLEYFEQPMPAGLVGEAAKLKRLTRTPTALNEAVTTLESVWHILQLRAADYILPDTYQCGGILAVKKVAALCEAAGVPCVFHCAHDLGIKTAVMLHVVASTPNFPLANDCTYYGLEGDILKEPHRIEGGFMPVPRGPGLGVTVDEAKVAKYRVG